jgi:hypothetical protein
MKRHVAAFLWAICILAGPGAAQQPAPAGRPAEAEARAQFLAAADEVLADISKLVDLPAKAPLKKSIRSREEIREYLLQQLRESKEKDKRYADQRALERFGLLPRGFDLDGHLINLLTEQVAGLYDPKSGEFFIADWMDPLTQRVVMAHELVHALHDQHFHVEPWADAAKPNDDAQLARQAVLEGSATTAMIHYLLRGRADLAEADDRAFESIVRMLSGANAAGMSPELQKSPPFLRDALIFPYVSGALFTHQVMQRRAGWKEFWEVFQKPPVSTQQILHPQMYMQGVVPAVVVLPDITRSLGQRWRRLDENVLGEFGLQSILKQYLDEERAAALAPAWAGDRYAIYENKALDRTALAFRVRFSSAEHAARFLGQYSEALEKKHPQHRNLFRRPGVFSLESPEGGVFLACFSAECISLEGAARPVFDTLLRALHWPIPARPAAGRTTVKTASVPVTSIQYPEVSASYR